MVEPWLWRDVRPVVCPRAWERVGGGCAGGGGRGGEKVHDVLGVTVGRRSVAITAMTVKVGLRERVVRLEAGVVVAAVVEEGSLG